MKPKRHLAMNKNSTVWMLPLAGSILFNVAAQGQEPPPALEKNPPLEATNRFSLSLRFSLNLKSRFEGIGGSLNPSLYNGFNRQTPDGAAYNYDNGYVLTDVSGNAGGQSWNWGYDNASQVNAGNHTISFNRTTAVAGGNGGGDASDAGVTPGFEIAYDRQLGVKEDWHNLRYGLEAAFNYLPVSVNNNSVNGAIASQQTDVYGYTSGTTPPSSPYQGTFNGPGFVINVPSVSSSTVVIPNASVMSHDDLEANLWGFRLGPYLELPLGQQQQFTLSVSAGLAVGLLAANESWKQTVTIPGYGSFGTQGGGNNLEMLWGGYASLNVNYQFSQHWGAIGGVQFQDLGKYDHTFDGRKVSLDLSQSVFFTAGISYSF